MSYPTYRQDFEGGSTLAAACPELVDLTSGFSISTSGHALTGTHSLSNSTAAGGNYIYSLANDTLSGNVTLTMYTNSGSFNGFVTVMSRIRPAGQLSANTWLRLLFNTSGITITQNNAGTGTALNTPISGAAIPTGVWLCLELRCNGTAISARIVRQDTGQFFVNTGTGSWSSSPQVQTGTTTVTGAGGFGFRGGDGISTYIDDWIIEPAVPSIDLPTFTLSGAGSTQALTAGGFTDPLFGETWASSDTSIATVGLTTGLVTAVGAGTATITATGKRDTTQTATAAVTVTTAAVTTYTSTAPSPTSGYAHNASGNFTFALGVGTIAGTVVITPNDGGNGGTFTPTTISLSSGTRSGTCTYTPVTAATIAIASTNNGGLTDPGPVFYTSLAQGLAVSPTIFFVATPAVATYTGTGTRWLSTPPTITLTGSAAAGTSLGTLTVINDVTASQPITPGSTQGSLTFHDSTTSATASALVGAAATFWTYPSRVVNFAPGLAGTVGYTVLKSDGTVYATRTTAGISEITTAAAGALGYRADVLLPTSGNYDIVWDNGSGRGAFETIYVRGVEPPSTAAPSGINESQALSLILAAIANLCSGFVPSGTSNPSFLATDGATPRLSGTCDQLGNRSANTYNPPL